MYRDKKKGVKRFLWILILLACLCGIGLFSLRKEDHTEAIASIRKSIMDCAVQCYVVEGVYPPSLSYLEENYGLTLNKEDYYIHYEIFAENLPPEVRITKRNR